MATEKRKAYLRQYYAEHRAERLEYQRNYYLTHKDECLARTAEYHRQNPEKSREWVRKSKRKKFIEDPEKVREYYRNYYASTIKTDPVKVEKRNRRRRIWYWAKKAEQLRQNPEVNYFPFDARDDELETVVNGIKTAGLTLVGMDGKWFIEFDASEDAILRIMTMQLNHIFRNLKCKLE